MTTTVKTRYGMLQGKEHHGVAVFCGIPYAAPPIGERRWRPPEPPESWEGIRQAKDWPAIPFQPEGWVGEKALRENCQSEDCLYLNIWTPSVAKESKMPVLVWIHGGGFMGGCAHEELYHGDAFARKGIVVVTVAYRLGVFGFLVHPALGRENSQGVSGNYGILDQIAALRWVQENIESFGGDPQRVTIAGQSAGGMSVSVLLSSPLTVGLFHAAIIQSGGPAEGKCPMMQETEAFGENIFRKAGPLCELRKIPPEDVMKLIDFNQENPGFWPCVDEFVIKETPYQAFCHGRIHPVPLLIGSNTDEHLFSGPEGDHQNLCRICKALTDVLPVPVYLYLFGQKSRTMNGEVIGAVHSAEIFYVFKTLSSREQNVSPNGEKFGIINMADDWGLAELMNDFWKEFVVSQVPIVSGCDWEEFHKSGRYMYFEAGKTEMRSKLQ